MQPRNRADTRYGFDIYPWWNNLNDRVSYQREFSTGYPQQMRIAQAMLSQNPLTPDSEIRSNMTVRGVPARYGYNRDELTITQILNHDYELADTHVNDSGWNDFSGSNGESNATERPFTPSTGTW